eukprot:GILJ01010571.1.p1 GENE.GILJ01010571.1~~GILJ01010571.1.p1  ORF type:complete len:706 (+),score=179.07 GILJ01010571.1:1025-3142(+)
MAAFIIAAALVVAVFFLCLVYQRNMELRAELASTLSRKDELERERKSIAPLLELQAKFDLSNVEELVKILTVGLTGSHEAACPMKTTLLKELAMLLYSFPSNEPLDAIALGGLTTEEEQFAKAEFKEHSSRLEDGLTENASAFVELIASDSFSTEHIDKIIEHFKRVQMDYPTWQKSLNILMPLLECARQELAQFSLDDIKANEIIQKYILAPIGNLFDSQKQHLLMEYDETIKERVSKIKSIQSQVDALTELKTAESVQQSIQLQKVRDELLIGVLQMNEKKRKVIFQTDSVSVPAELDDSKAQGNQELRVWRATHEARLESCSVNIERLNHNAEYFRDINKLRLDDFDKIRFEYEQFLESDEKVKMNNLAIIAKTLESEVQRIEFSQAKTRSFQSVKSLKEALDSMYFAAMDDVVEHMNQFQQVQLHDLAGIRLVDCLSQFMNEAVNEVKSFCVNRVVNLMQSKEEVLHEHYDNFCNAYLHFYRRLMTKNLHVESIRRDVSRLQKKMELALQHEDVQAARNLEEEIAALRVKETDCLDEIGHLDEFLHQVNDSDIDTTLVELNALGCHEQHPHPKAEVQLTLTALAKKDLDLRLQTLNESFDEHNEIRKRMRALRSRRINVEKDHIFFRGGSSACLDDGTSSIASTMDIEHQASYSDHSSVHSRTVSRAGSFDGEESIHHHHASDPAKLTVSEPFTRAHHIDL